MKTVKFIVSVLLGITLVSCNSSDVIDGDFYYGQISYQCGPTDGLILEVLMTDNKVQQCNAIIKGTGAYLSSHLEGVAMESFAPQLKLYPHDYGPISETKSCDEVGDCINYGQMYLEIDSVLQNHIEGTYQIENSEGIIEGQFVLLMCKNITTYMCG